MSPLLYADMVHDYNKFRSNGSLVTISGLKRNENVEDIISEFFQNWIPLDVFKKNVCVCVCVCLLATVCMLSPHLQYVLESKAVVVCILPLAHALTHAHLHSLPCRKFLVRAKTNW